MEALIGLVMVSSNSGNTSPDAVMVFSILPFSTTAVVKADRFKEDRKEARRDQMARNRSRIRAPAISRVFLFLLAITCSERAVSIMQNLHDGISIQVPNINQC